MSLYADPPREDLLLKLIAEFITYWAHQRFTIINLGPDLPAREVPTDAFGMPNLCRLIGPVVIYHDGINVRGTTRYAMSTDEITKLKAHEWDFTVSAETLELMDEYTITFTNHKQMGRYPIYALVMPGGDQYYVCLDILMRKIAWSFLWGYHYWDYFPKGLPV